jgi:hypothetical protein
VIVDLSESFPDGVFKLDCGQGVVTSSLLGFLLDNLKGREEREERDLREIRGTERQDIRNQLGRQLTGMRCLIWLDSVRDPMLVEACCPEGFAGALLVTATKDISADMSLPNCFSVHITPDLFWTAPEESGNRIARKILAARAANEVEDFPPGCEVGVERQQRYSRSF